MPRARSSILIAGLAAARQRMKPTPSPEQVGRKIGVSGRTLERWEAGGYVPLAHVPDLERFYNTRFPEAHTGDAEGPRESAASAARHKPILAADAPVGYTEEDIERFVTTYHRRKANGADDDELLTIQDLVSFAWDKRLSVKISNPRLRQLAVRAIVRENLGLDVAAHAVAAARKKRV